jgi:hypothetical protein
MWDVIAMPRRFVLSVLLLCSPSLIGSLAQAPTANPPFDVKEGLWDLTQTTYNVMLDGWLDKLPREVTPEQRAQMLEAQKDPRSHATPEKRTICLTREKLDQAEITQHSTPCTAIRVASIGTSITRHSECQGVRQEAQFERIDAETFNGTEISSFSGDPTQEHVEVAAKWAGDDCEGIKKVRRYAAGLAAGIDPDVLSFLPPRLPNSDDGVGRFGPFHYYWSPRGGGVPSLVYRASLPDAPPDAPKGVFATWFAGTDGEYLYVVLHHDPDTCRDPTALNFRLDHSGTMSRIGLLPPNLHGGRGAPCG